MMDMEDKDLYDPSNFDFFHSPRKGDGSSSPIDLSPHRDTLVTETSKFPPPPMKYRQFDHSEAFSYNFHIEQNSKSGVFSQGRRKQKGRTHSSESDLDINSISSHSSNDSRQSESSGTGNTRSCKDNNHDDHVKDNKNSSNSPEKRDNYLSCSASSSAYSDMSSDEHAHRKESPNVYEKVKNDRPTRNPQFNKREAWNKESAVDNIKNETFKTTMKRQNEKQSRHITFNERTTYGKTSLGSDSDYSVSDISDSEMTNVWPHASPEVDPSSVVHRKNKHVTRTDGETLECRKEKNMEHHQPGDVLLKTTQINMSLLIHAVSEIETDRRDRIKANARRVMFAPPKKSEKENYSFGSHRTEVINKEKQRLLKELMKRISNQHKDKTAKLVDSLPLPAGRRPTTSAVNRRKDQQRIEMENWGLLNRLQEAKPTRGLSKTEQLTDYQRTVHYCAPSQRKPRGTLSAYENSMHDGARRGSGSRPSSAKSQTSVFSMRPSSAKSCMSVFSIQSRSSIGNRPVWNDRLSYI